MKNLIYYFTGTGNSLVTARLLAEKINGETELRAITNYMDQSEVIVDAEETVGFVFPIYGGDAPWPVKAVVEKMKILNDPYIYAIGTCNERGGTCMDLFSGLMKRYGYKLSYGKKLDMPGNCMESNEGENIERIELASSRVDVFAKNINNRFVGSVHEFDSPDNTAEATKNRFGGMLMFTVDAEKCIGCGICAEVCPTNNIKIEDGKAVTGGDCSFCFGCFHWCPQKAMFNERFSKRSQYHHPEVTVADVAKQGERV